MRSIVLHAERSSFKTLDPLIGLDHAICNARRVWFFASYAWLFGATTALLILTSALTYGGHTLTP